MAALTRDIGAAAGELKFGGRILPQPAWRQRHACRRAVGLWIFGRMAKKWADMNG